MNQPTTTVTAAIIAGGQGLRLGGEDKALVRIGGRPQLARVLASLQSQSAAQILVSNRDPSAYAGFGLPVVADACPGQPGPLAGIHAALQYCGSGDVLCVPVDALWLPEDLLERLAHARRQAGTPAACVHDGAGLQPVCCLLAAALAESARQALASGDSALHRWLKSCGVATADFSHWPRWAWSFNTPQELELARVNLNET